MNNEEKILSLLGTMNGKLEVLTKDVAELKEGQAKLEREVVKTNMIIENEIRKNVQILAEGHGAVVEKLEKLDTLSEDVEDVKMAVSVLKLLQIKKD